METYVSFLLQDIKNAGRHASTRPTKKLSFEEEMEAIENWASGDDRPQSFSYVSGLTIDQFPPKEQLKEEEMKSIVKALEEMLETWCHKVCLPDNVPVELAYPLIVGILNEEAWFLPGGFICHDFCTGHAPDCDLKEYCPCLEYWNKPLIPYKDEE